MIFMFVPFGVFAIIATILLLLLGMYADSYYAIGCFWFVTFAIWFVKTLIKESSVSKDIDVALNILVAIMAIISCIVTMICISFI